MEQDTNQDRTAETAPGPRRTPETAPTAALFQADPRAGYVPGAPAKRKWWTLPKILVAAAVAVLLAGGGGGAIGYSMGKSDATRQFSQRLQNGRPNGANGQARRSPGTGQNQVQPTAPSTPGTNGNL